MIEIDVEIKKRDLKVKQKMHPMRVVSCCMIPVILFVCIVFGLYQLYLKYERANEAVVQQLIAQTKKNSGIVLPSDDPNSDDPYAAHAKEIFSTLAYAQTQWKTINNQELNFFMEYPDNTSAEVNNAADDQIWFLRRNGYMFRVDIYQTSQSEMDFYNSLGNKADYSVTQVMFAKHKALFLQQINTSLPIVSAQYIVANQGYIFEIWYEVYPNNTYPDDTKRIQFMLNSFEFTNLPVVTPTARIIRVKGVVY